MKYLGIDLGSKTLGLARGSGIMAFAWTTLRFEEHNFDDAITQLQVIITTYQPNVVVFGYPLNMDGTTGNSTQTVLNFIEKFKLRENNAILTIVLQDERKTTYSSQQILIKANVRRQKQKAMKDQLAAAIILQSYFNKINQK